MLVRSASSIVFFHLGGLLSKLQVNIGDHYYERLPSLSFPHDNGLCYWQFCTPALSRWRFCNDELAGKHHAEMSQACQLNSAFLISSSQWMSFILDGMKSLIPLNRYYEYEQSGFYYNWKTLNTIIERQLFGDNCWCMKLILWICGARSEAFLM